MSEFKVELALPPNALSPNEKPLTRGGAFAKRRATKVYRVLCAWAFRTAAPRDWKACPVVIDIEYRAHRGCGGYHPRDEDNARASMKAGIDGLADAGIVPTDSARNVRWGEFNLVTTRRACGERGSGVTVIVRTA